MPSLLLFISPAGLWLGMVLQSKNSDAYYRILLVMEGYQGRKPIWGTGTPRYFNDNDMVGLMYYFQMLLGYPILGKVRQEKAFVPSTVYKSQVLELDEVEVAQRR